MTWEGGGGWVCEVGEQACTVYVVFPQNLSTLGAVSDTGILIF